MPQGLPLQGLVNNLEGILEVAEFRTIDGHKFVAWLRAVRRNGRIYGNVFAQTEDGIDSQKVLLKMSLTFAGKEPIDKYFRCARMRETAQDADRSLSCAH